MARQGESPGVETLTLAAGAARVVAAPALGGSILAFEWRGAPVLRATPPEALDTRIVRQTACYPLVPYSNRIRAASLALEGRRHALARNFGGDHPHSIHGVGWQSEWHVVQASASRATLELVHDASNDAARAWPWPFRANQSIDLADHGERALLTMGLTIENTGAAHFPFGLGWHPFFPRDATTTLAFDADQVWRNDDTQLPLERAAITADESFAQPRAFGSATIDTVYCGFGGTATLTSSQRGIETTVEADSACRFLIVYAPSQRDFVALEPVTHETDAFNRANEGATGTGMRVLPPRAAFSCTMRIGATFIAQ